MPPRVQAAQRVHYPPDAELLHSLQHVQLAQPAQASAADAHLKHKDGGRQVLPESNSFTWGSVFFTKRS